MRQHWMGRKRPSGWAAAAVIALVVAAALAGCSSSKSTGTNSGSGGESLSVAIGAEPGSLDPLLDADGQAQTFQYSVYEGLTARDGDKIVPALATEWALKGDTWEFKLREGVKFQNGQALTADDVVASWNRILSKDSENLGNVVVAGTSVKAIDDMTVGITGKVVDPTTPARASLVMITPASYAATGNDQLQTEMMGTGPYALGSWDRTKQITLKAFPGYWGDKPKISEVTMKFADEDSVRLASLQAGEVQMALSMSPDLAQGDFKVVASPISEVGMLRVNSEAGPFTDPKVREAASLAIDRETLMSTLYGGYANPAKNQIVSSSVFGYDPALADAQYDPEQAKQLLEDAGATGTKITVMGTRGRWLSDAQVGEAVAEMLKNVGFDVDLQQPPFDDWLDAYFQQDASAAPDLVLLNHSNQLFDSAYSIAQLLQCDGSSSTTCDQKLEDMANQARGELDDATRDDDYHQIWQYVADQVYTIPIAEVLKVNFTANNVEWTPEADGFLRFQNMNLSS